MKVCILNLQKLINISHQLEITPVSDDSKPEILQLLNSVKEHIAEVDQEITAFCQQNDYIAAPTMFKCGSYLPAHLTFMMRTPGEFAPHAGRALPLPA